MAAVPYPRISITPKRSGMRAVIADPDPFRRRLLRNAVLGERGYELVGEVGSAATLMDTIETETPELAICAGSIADEYLSAAGAWPVLVTVGWRSGSVSERVVCNVPPLCEAGDLARALAAATSRILQLKAAELSGLIRAYLEFRGEAGARIERLEVEGEDGRHITLPLGDILWIKAARNYVQLFTVQGTFEIRDTVSNIAEKLEPSGFVRIHRCAIVNSEAITERSLAQGAVAWVVLRDGSRLFVGPSFRQRLRPRPESAGPAAADVLAPDLRARNDNP